MIMQAKIPAEFQRTFTKILRVARRQWREIESDSAQKTARGTFLGDDKLIVATLSYDDIEHRLTLTVRLPFRHELDVPTMRRILRYQNSHRDSGFIAFDEETRIVSIWTNVAVDKKKPSLAVHHIFRDTLKLLNDEDLNELIN